MNSIDIIAAVAAELGLSVSVDRPEPVVINSRGTVIHYTFPDEPPRLTWMNETGCWDVAVVGDELVVGGWMRFALADPALLDQVREFLGS